MLTAAALKNAGIQAGENCNDKKLGAGFLSAIDARKISIVFDIERKAHAHALANIRV